MSTTVSREWFVNILKSAIRDGVTIHEDAGRMVGWTILESFDRQLPNASFQIIEHAATPSNPDA